MNNYYELEREFIKEVTKLTLDSDVTLTVNGDTDTYHVVKEKDGSYELYSTSKENKVYGLSCNGLADMMGVLLQDYAKGILTSLQVGKAPCKVGDRLYLVLFKEGSYIPLECEVLNLLISKDSVKANVSLLSKKYPALICRLNLLKNFGNTIFTSKEKAEEMANLRNLIKEGLESDFIELIPCPDDENSIVCEIGDYWFYFDEGAIDLTPEEYRESRENFFIVGKIAEAMMDLDDAEHDYYTALLEERKDLTKLDNPSDEEHHFELE